MNDYLKYTFSKDAPARKRLTAIVKRLSAYTTMTGKDNPKILDLGCGIGGISFPLSYLGYRVVGIDVDPQSIDECIKENTFPDATFLVGDIAVLDLKEKFDIIICSEVLEHSPQPERLLRTIGKHLNPDGIAILTIPNGYSFHELVLSRLFRRLKITALFHKLPRGIYRMLTSRPDATLNVACSHVQFFTLNRFIKLLNESRLHLVDISNQNLGLFLDWRWLKPLSWLECKLADFVPHAIARGWILVIRKEQEA